MARPLLLIDVDGVLSLFGFPAHARPDGQWLLVDGIPHLISADAGRHLRVLAGAYELVWCTGWEEKANDYLPVVLGLDGPLPFLSFDEAPTSARGPAAATPRTGPRAVLEGNPMGLPGHWKLAAIDAYAGPTRPLAWIDDAHDAACERWARQRPGSTLLVPTDPAIGLLAADVESLLSWADAEP